MEIGNTAWKETIISGARALGMTVGPVQVNQFALHAKVLMEWNRKMNLTAIDSPLDIAVKHVLDSIAPCPFIPLGSRLLDVGSGGGFPGIPLKIMVPSLSVTLMDSTLKKIHFLKHVIWVLKLEDISADHNRIEDVGNDLLYLHAFDVVVCRAFSSLERFVAHALPLLSADGMIIAYKGKAADETLALKKNRRQDGTERYVLDVEDGRVSLKVKTIRYQLPVFSTPRSLIILNR